MAKILDGKKLSGEIIQDLKEKIAKSHLKLILGVVLAGNNKVSKIYINQKRKSCQKVGIGFKLFKFSPKITTSELKVEIKKILSSVSGLIIQLPLPPKIQTQEILNSVPSEKDVDCLSATNMGKFYTGNLLVLPPIVNSISQLFRKYKIKVKGKNIVIIGAGKLVGKPLTMWFLQKKAAVSVINKFTKNIILFTQNADILILGAGKPNLIKERMIKKDAVVIDCGSSYQKRRLAGDVDFKSVSRKASYITPVPGGVGPLTVACLLQNLVKRNI